MTASSLQTTEAASAANAKAPRVALADITNAIAFKSWVTGDKVAKVSEAIGTAWGLETFTLCILVMRNGFVVVGKSAPASPENFDPALGKQFAYEDAIRQLWPLMGYSLRDQLAGDTSKVPSLPEDTEDRLAKKRERNAADVEKNKKGEAAQQRQLAEKKRKREAKQRK